MLPPGGDWVTEDRQGITVLTNSSVGGSTLVHILLAFHLNVTNLGSHSNVQDNNSDDIDMVMYSPMFPITTRYLIRKKERASHNLFC